MQLTIPNMPQTQTERTVCAIAEISAQQAIQLKRSYELLRQLTGYTPEGVNQFGLTTAEVWAAIETMKPNGMDAMEYAQLAQATKAVLNRFVTPPTIVDVVPEATFTFPKV